MLLSVIIVGFFFKGHIKCFFTMVLKIGNMPQNCTEHYNDITNSSIHKKATSDYLIAKVPTVLSLTNLKATDFKYHRSSNFCELEFSWQNNKNKLHP